MKLIGAITSPYVRKVRIVMAEKKLDYQFVPEDVWSADTAIMHLQSAGQSALPDHGRWRGGVRLARDRRVPGHALAGGQADSAVRAASAPR